jgi:hypothetical protein
VDDGNKESTKELLGAFRIIASADISIALATLAFIWKSANRPADPLVTISIVCLTISFLASVYLFLLAIPMLNRQQANIIGQPPIKITSAVSLFLFLIGATILGGYLATNN